MRPRVRGENAQVPALERLSRRVPPSPTPRKAGSAAMLLRLPTSVSEAQECMAEGAEPIGGATLVWATWQRDGFPERAMSLRDLPEANEIGGEALGSAVV